LLNISVLGSSDAKSRGRGFWGFDDAWAKTGNKAMDWDGSMRPLIRQIEQSYMVCLGVLLRACLGLVFWRFVFALFITGVSRRRLSVPRR
jgi:hypothetical protein